MAIDTSKHNKGTVNIGTDYNRTVTIRLKGGLGNQLFQYATARALAIENNAALYLDCAWYKRANKNRDLKLTLFPIKAQLKDIKKAHRLGLKCAYSAMSIFHLNQVRYATEPASHNYIDFKKSPAKHIYMDGYWQATQYFENHRQLLLSELQAPQNILSTLPPSIANNTVSVHIRRGDYMHDKNAHVVTERYVRSAMARFNSEHQFLFFSDDIPWCQQTFKADNIAFANNPSDVHDLIHMSRCSHNIIANSSFSWWGAWLNTTPEKRVIAPSPWTAEGSHKDILPDAWETQAIA